MLEVATDGEPSLDASLVSTPIHAWVAPSVCHVIGMVTTDEELAQSTSPAGRVLEPKEVITAAAARVVEALVDGVVEGELVVGEGVLLGDVVAFVVGAAERFADDDVAGGLAADVAGAVGVGVADVGRTAMK